VYILQRLPQRWKRAVFTKAYRSALRGPPFQYVHLILLTIGYLLPLGLLVLYGVWTYLAFSGAPETDLSTALKPVPFLRGKAVGIFSLGSFRWVLLGVTILLVLSSIKTIFVILPSEFILPHAHRLFESARESVFKCSTKKQYLDYVDLERKAASPRAYSALLDKAEKICGRELHSATLLRMGVVILEVEGGSHDENELLE